MSGGLFSSPRKLLDSALGLAQNRAELFAIEWQEERSRLVELLVWLAASVFLSIMTAVALTATIILLIEDPRTRLIAAICFCALYLGGAIVAGVCVSARIRRAETPFRATLDEVRLDRELFRDT